MARRPRIEYEGTLYHVMSRGDHGEPIFKDDADRETFLRTVGEVKERTGWLIHAYVLMRNHFHALVETPEANLVAGMKWFLGTYTQRYNVRHGVRGHLFQGRYKAVIMDEDEDGYTQRVSDYIHLNPVRAGRVDLRNQCVKDYSWSSFPEYVSTPRRRNRWLTTSRVYAALALKDDRGGRRAYEEYMEERAKVALTKKGRCLQDAEWKAIRRGWCLGGKEYKERLLEMLDELILDASGEAYVGQAVREHGERAADVLIGEGLKKLGLKESGLELLPKSDPRKSVLAWYVSSKTTVSQRWIGERLHMGSRGTVSNAIWKVRREGQGRSRRLQRMLESQ